MKEESKEEGGAATTEATATEASSSAVTYPLQVVYDPKSGVPPEYNEYFLSGNDLEESKTWLADAHPELFESIYPPAEEGQEESKKTKKVKVKKVGFATDAEKKIRVVKLKRSGKKTISSIVGLHAYGCDLEDVAKIFARKLGSGAAAMNIEYREINEMGIQVQGDVSDKLEAILQNELAQYNIPWEKVVFEDGGNKKNRTMGGGR